jgi:hypothetical protein
MAGGFVLIRLSRVLRVVSPRWARRAAPISNYPELTQDQIVEIVREIEIFRLSAADVGPLSSRRSCSFLAEVYRFRAA